MKKYILKISLIIGLLVVVGGLGLAKVKAATINLDDSITKPYILSGGNTYNLTSDINAPGTAFVVGGDNINLNLNGHTVTFGNANSPGVANSGFESGTTTVPTDWNLQGATSAKRVSTTEMPLLGHWALKLEAPTTNQEVVSTWVNLTNINRTYMAAVIIKSCQNCSFRIRIEDANSNSLSEVGGTNFINSPMLFTQFKPTIPGNYRVRLIFENPAGNTAYIDEVDLKPAYDSGIVLRNLNTNETPDIPENPSANFNNITISNGKIIEGAGQGYKFRPIHKSGGSTGRLEINNVETYVSGIESSNLWLDSNSSNVVFHDSKVTNTAAWLMDSTGTLNYPVIIGNDSKVYNSTFDGGQGGIIVNGGGNVEIYNNTLNINTRNFSHFGISINGANGVQVYNNRINSAAGSGLTLTNGTNNTEVRDNFFNINAAPCYGDYYNDWEGPTEKYISSAIYVNDISFENPSNSIHNNYLRGSARFYGEYPDCVPGIAGIYLNSSQPNTYSNNSIQMNVADAIAEAFGIYAISPTFGTIENNFIESNHANLRIGSPWSGSTGLFRSNTLSRRADYDPMRYNTIKLGYYAAYQNDNITFVDNRTVGGASLNNIHPLSYTLGGYTFDDRWFLNMSLKDTNNQPISSANISILDSNSQSVFSGLTDVNGKVSNIELKQLTRSSTYDRGNELQPTYVYFTPHSINIAKAGFQSKTINLTMDSSKDLSVILAPSSQPTDPPIVSNIGAKVGDSSVVISWQTDRNADSKVDWGTTTSYGSQVSDAAMVTSHALTIYPPSAGTYHFQVTSRDTQGLENKSQDNLFIMFVQIQGSTIVTVQKSVSLTNADRGDILIYTLDYVNSGTASATNVVIRDQLPTNTAYIRGGTLTNNNITWNIGTVPPGTGGSVSFLAQVL